MVGYENCVVSCRSRASLWDVSTGCGHDTSVATLVCPLLPYLARPGCWLTGMLTLIALSADVSACNFFPVKITTNFPDVPNVVWLSIVFPSCFFLVICLNEDCRRPYQGIDSPGQQLSSAWRGNYWLSCQRVKEMVQVYILLFIRWLLCNDLWVTFFSNLETIYSCSY